MIFKTAFNGYSVKFSPFEDGRIAIATAQNFGIIGNGRQYVVQVGIQCKLQPESRDMCRLLLARSHLLRTQYRQTEA